MGRWSGRELKVLGQMLADGADYQTIASALNRKKQSVYDKASELGLVKKDSGSEPLKEGCSFQEDGNTATASSLARHIRTVEDLLNYAQVDRAIWEVEKCIINRWETVMREPATTVGGAGDKAVISHGKDGSQATLWTRGSKEPLHEPLYQVKVWLRRKAPQVRATEALLAKLAQEAPLLPVLRFPKAKAGQRSLEVCVMDPHVGLLCQYPEADCAWDLDQAAQSVLLALDDLIQKASVYGPFAEVFAPFGNDFVHADNVFNTTTAGTPQPEALSWHRVYEVAEALAITMVSKLREAAPVVHIYEVPGNHSRVSDFSLAHVLRAYFHADKAVRVHIHCSSSPYKFHRCGVNLIGYEHGHSVKVATLPGLMANECREDWSQTAYHEWHLGDQHRKGGVLFESQGVSAEYVPGITAPNEWHRLKGFNHQQRGAMAFVWDHETGPVARLQFNISKLTHKPMLH